MAELAKELKNYSERKNDSVIAQLASDYTAKTSGELAPASDVEDNIVGYVYMQRYLKDYKIGFTKSLNKRGRQIQLELPQEVELVHSILTDDPAGVEAYWHRRYAAKRTRGEWFKLNSADVKAFKRWSKIW